MTEIGKFDTGLGMFVAKEPLEPKITHLRELRWRAEKGYFGHLPLSTPRGANLFKLTDEEIKYYAMKQADTELI